MFFFSADARIKYESKAETVMTKHLFVFYFILEQYKSVNIGPQYILDE